MVLEALGLVVDDDVGAERPRETVVPLEEVLAARDRSGRPSMMSTWRLGLLSLPDRDVTDRARDPAPLVDRDLLVGLAGEVEPTDRRARERADRRQRRSRDALISPLRGKMRRFVGKSGSGPRRSQYPRSPEDFH